MSCRLGRLVLMVRLAEQTTTAVLFSAVSQVVMLPRKMLLMVHLECYFGWHSESVLVNHSLSGLQLFLACSKCWRDRRVPCIHVDFLLFLCFSFGFFGYCSIFIVSKKKKQVNFSSDGRVIQGTPHTASMNVVELSACACEDKLAL